MYKFVHPSENLLFAVVVSFSVLIYLSLLSSPLIFSYLIMFLVLSFLSHALFLCHIRGNGVKVTPQQFSNLYQTLIDICQKLDLKDVPDVYIIQGGGMLNAFATKLIARRFVVLYADILEIAYDNGEDAVKFVLAHELAHIKRKHVARQWLTMPGRMIPFLGSAYSRSCEYTCDRIAVDCSPRGGVSGLMALAVGKRLYKQIDLAAYLAQAQTEGGFWFWFTEKMSSHPYLFKRIAAIHAVPEVVMIAQSQAAATLDAGIV